MKRISALIFILILVISLASCSANTPVVSNPKDFDLSAYDLNSPIPFEIVMESGERMEGELYYDIAPITVANFITLADSGFYNGIKFHRVVNDILIQGGEQTDTPHTIRGEFSENGWNNTLSHNRGAISMARAEDLNSAYSQFFICLTKIPALDGKYAAFGRITSGMPVADSIADTQGEGETPTTEQIIAEINILANK